MKIFIIIMCFLATNILKAAPQKETKTISEQSQILEVLSALIKDNINKLSIRSGMDFDFSVMTLAGYKVTKITFTNSSDTKNAVCNVGLEFNSPYHESNKIIDFVYLENNPNYKFNWPAAYCN